jgi:dihydrofolate reductase
MRVAIVAAITADGFIARSQHELADWTSKEDKRFFHDFTKEAGVMVMGGTTYRTIGRPLPGRRNIVYSRQTDYPEGVELTQEAPAELVARLRKEDCKTLAICGGQSIYDMFLAAGVVDEIYLTVEALLFGQGISLLAKSPETKLHLLESRQLNDDTLLLHYEVQK